MRAKKITFSDLSRLARERSYTLKRSGNKVLWWRNEDPQRVFCSFGMRSAMEDILLDYSSKKHLGRGTTITTTQENNRDHERKDDHRAYFKQGTH